MKLYVCTDHDGYWGVGVASVILACDEDHARQLLDIHLEGRGLKAYKDCPYTLTEVNRSKPKAIILNDGNY